MHLVQDLFCSHLFTHYSKISATHLWMATPGCFLWPVVKIVCHRLTLWDKTLRNLPVGVSLISEYLQPCSCNLCDLILIPDVCACSRLTKLYSRTWTSFTYIVLTSVCFAPPLASAYMFMVLPTGVQHWNEDR